MSQPSKRTRLAVERAIEYARQDGLSADEITAMVASEQASIANNPQEVPAEERERIFDVLPDGLIDLPSASRKYNIPVRTLQSWVKRGKLPRRGRLKARAAGGGYIMTEEAAIPYCRDNPRKPWHKKSAHS